MNDALRASEITLASLFERSARIFAKRVAVVDDAGRHTYEEVETRARRLASALHASGLAHGDRIAVLAEPRREYCEIYIAAAYAGLTVVALNTRLHADEIAECLRVGKPKMIFVSGPLASVLEKSLAALGQDRKLSEHVIGLDLPYESDPAYEAWSSKCAPIETRADVRASDIHNVLFTSGTTGKPKGAMISQGAAATRALRLAQWFRLTPNDGFIGWLPMFHCGGDESFYATWLTGGIFAPFAKVDQVKMFERIASDRLSWTLLLPGVITDFLNHPRRSDFDLSSMRFAIGYGNMMPNVVKQLTGALGITFFDAFGQTETSYLVAHDEVPIGALPTGRKNPLPHLEIRIVDESMNELAAGIPGECVVRGPSVMSGYLDDEAATADAFRGGWLHTGDVLVRNDDGTLTFTDRKKYLVKTGGENVYPAEVEAVIALHPAVQEVCVLGVPDAHWGEAIAAVIVVREGQSVTAEEVIRHCRDRLASFKRPRHVHFSAASEMPRSTTGKLLRHELAARLAAK
jgi:fatty-acyl-CoA synthase